MMTAEEKDLHILYLPQPRRAEPTLLSWVPGLFPSVSDPLGALEKPRLTQPVRAEGLWDTQNDMYVLLFPNLAPRCVCSGTWNCCSGRPFESSGTNPVAVPCRVTCAGKGAALALLRLLWKGTMGSC